MRRSIWLVGLTLLVPHAWAQPDAMASDETDHLKWERSSRPSLTAAPAGEPADVLRAAGAIPNALPSQSDDRASTDPQEWTIRLQDRTLYRTMRRWAQDAGFQLLWQTDRDFPIEAEVAFRGDFRSAVSETMAGLIMSDHPLQAVFNNQARTVRVIRQRESSLR